MGEPTGKPVLTGPSRSSRADAEWALTKARRYIFRGGTWTASLNAYVDRWLDFLRSIPADADRPGKSESDSTGKDQR